MLVTNASFATFATITFSIHLRISKKSSTFALELGEGAFVGSEP